MWADRSRILVLDATKIFVYAATDGGRRADLDIDLAAANADPRGLWSDGHKVWVVDRTDQTFYVYDLDGGARDTGLGWSLDTLNDTAGGGGVRRHHHVGGGRRGTTPSSRTR